MPAKSHAGKRVVCPCASSFLLLAAGWLCLGLPGARAAEVMKAEEGTAARRASVYRPAPNQTLSSRKPLALPPGPHLFLDDYLIDQTANVSRRVQGPARDPQLGNPLITGREDLNFQPYLSVVREAGTGQFRIWYCARTADRNPLRAHIGTMESADGIRWRRPVRVLADPAPIEVGCSVLDEGPAFPDAAARYKLAWCWFEPGGRLEGLKLAVSPDGRQFQPLTPEVVLAHSHDINNLFRDTLRQRYVATISVTGRRTMQSTSADLRHWTKPWYVVLPDPSDPPETQFYAMSGYLLRGGLWIGLVKVLHDNWQAAGTRRGAYGVGHTQLAWSRDGEHWVRDQTPFFEPDPTPGAWDHAHAWIDCQVIVEDQVYLYYAGYQTGHKVNRFEERQLGLVRMLRDRYVARAADAKGGTLTTVPVTLSGRRLTVNAEVRGELRVQLRTAAGEPMPGYQCQPIRGNGVALPVAWTAAQGLPRQPVRIEFQMKETHLYGFAAEE